jgi:hypothetical protein
MTWHSVFANPVTRRPAATMEVHITHAPNPDLYDRGGYWHYVPEPVDIWLPVHSYEEASQVARRFIQSHDLGGGNWTGGQIRRNGRIIAHVSFNGAVWKGKSYRPGAKPIWAPWA